MQEDAIHGVTTRVLYWAVGMLLIILLLGGWRHVGNVILFLAAAGLLAAKLYPRAFDRLLKRTLRTFMRVPPPPAPDESWACSVCDARNPSGVLECVQCRAAHDPEAPAAAGSDPVPDWPCRVCGAINPGDVNVCLRCTMPVRDPGDGGILEGRGAFPH